MSVICVVLPAPGESLSELTASLLSIVPRVVAEPRGLIWADARGLAGRLIAESLLDSLHESGVRNARAGVATTPIAAELAARLRIKSAQGDELRPLAGFPAAPLPAALENQTRPVLTPMRVLHSEDVSVVPAGYDTAFVATNPVELLDPSQHLFAMLIAVGIETCGDLAALDHQSVEVRFGAEGSRLWRLARADDQRRLFPAMPRNLPEASFEWVEYALRDPERLLFVINSLMGSVTKSLVERGECAREMTLSFSLSNRSVTDHRLRPARATSSQKAWMRLVRSDLERIRLSDAVTGISLRVDAVSPEIERQGDLFDRGFATARATEETIAQMLDDQGAIVVLPSNSAHPLLDRRTSWVAQKPGEAAHPRLSLSSAGDVRPRLSLQMLPEPRRINVLTTIRRDHQLPVRFMEDGQWTGILSALGPERVSGGEWEGDNFAREYYRCVTDEGTLVWIYRDGRSSGWFLHGWWD